MGDSWPKPWKERSDRLQRMQFWGPGGKQKGREERHKARETTQPGRHTRERKRQVSGGEEAVSRRARMKA